MLVAETALRRVASPTTNRVSHLASIGLQAPRRSHRFEEDTCRVLVVLHGAHLQPALKGQVATETTEQLRGRSRDRGWVRRQAILRTQEPEESPARQRNPRTRTASLHKRRRELLEYVNGDALTAQPLLLQPAAQPGQQS
jgi:hypothetical protein